MSTEHKARGRPPVDKDHKSRQSAFRLLERHYDYLRVVSDEHGNIGLNAALRMILDRYAQDHPKGR